MMKCRFACLSTRNSILPPLMSLTALATSSGHGAGLRVRHEAARTEDLAETADLAHEVGRGDGGVEVGPAAGDLLDQVVGADEVGAGRDCCLGLVAVAKTRTRAVLPVPCGRLTVPRTIWSALRGSTPRRKATSTVASNLAGWRSAWRARRPRTGRRTCPASILARRLPRYACCALPCCFVSLWSRGRGPRWASHREIRPLCRAGTRPGSVRRGAGLPEGVRGSQLTRRPSAVGASLDGDAHRASGAGDDLRAPSPRRWR